MYCVHVHVRVHGHVRVHVHVHVPQVLDWLLRHGANATAHAEHGDTPLQTAAFSGHFELMWRLHEAGAPLNGTNENGGSVLMSAVFHENDAEVDSTFKAIDTNGKGKISEMQACAAGLGRSS